MVQEESKSEHSLSPLDLALFTLYLENLLHRHDVIICSDKHFACV